MPTTEPRSDEATGEGRPRALSREQIADAGLALIDREGIDALTMRRLAADLGVGTMTLYGYFGDKDELVEAIVDRGASQFDFSAGEGAWEERLRELMRTMLRSLTEHPSAVQLRARGPILNPAALRAGEAGLRILADAGLDPADAARAWRLLFVYTFGYAAFVAPAAPEDAESWREQMSALPRDEFPLMVAVAAEAAGMLSGDEPFEHGLDLIIAGVNARVRSATPR